MKWDDSFALGIEAIDSQHRKIFEHLLALENAVSKRDPWHILHFFLAQLTDYVRFHLEVEDALLEIIGFPDRDDHAASHDRLRTQMARLEEQLKAKPTGETLVTFFEEWFVRHVLDGDRGYAAYIKEKLPGLASRPAV